MANPSLECFHCGLPVPSGETFTLNINNKTESFCCSGCQAVASMIHAGGLDQFYQFRSERNRKAEDNRSDDFSIFDSEDLQAGFVVNAIADEPKNHKTAYLLLDGITCAACVWLIEKYLKQQKGFVSVNLNAVSHECVLTWDTEATSLSQLMHSLDAIGYRPQPHTKNHQAQQQKQQQRLMLMRLGVAGFGMMQVTMVAVALYAGAWQDIEQEWVSLLRWLSLLVATPVVLFSAQPFWMNAYRNIKQRHLTMDVPVSIAIVLAYVASLWATMTQTGEVYFDSVAMFTFFLLVGRFLEMRLRHRNQQLSGNTVDLLPHTVNQLDGNDSNGNEKETIIPLLKLEVGDRVKVYAGDTIPCDGEVLSGSSRVSEALLTGEAKAIAKHKGDTVIGGTLNVQDTLIIRVSAVGQHTRLSMISQLVNRAAHDKPRAQIIANRVASYFVAGILLAAICVYTTWSFIEPESAFWVTLSVLVVTCPCALSLATPTALTAAVSSMRQKGLLVIKGHVVETLASINQVVLDKTGTITVGRPAIVDVITLGELDRGTIIEMAASLEQHSNHPLAFAFKNTSVKYHPQNMQSIPSQGVSGEIDGKIYRLGKPEYAAPNKNHDVPQSESQWLLLSCNEQALAWIGLDDPLRETARDAIEQLQQAGTRVSILSGDHIGIVSKVAVAVGIPTALANQLPEGKLDFIRQLQSEKNNKVLMVGDGINDVPVLAGADVSVAMDSASDFARTSADSVLLNDDLTVLPNVVHLAKKTRRIIKQNITWSVCYNLSALPLAAMGFIPPYLAAIGMSLSSLIVVINALRL